MTDLARSWTLEMWVSRTHLATRIPLLITFLLANNIIFGIYS